MASLQSSNQNLVLSIHKFNTFEDDVAPVFENTVVQKAVAGLERQYKALNVDQCMQKLMTVGDLLTVAYAGSKGFKCNASVVMLLAEYQTLTKDSHLASCEFLAASMKSLQCHSLALNMVNKHQPGKAFKALAMTSTVAGKMAVIADALVKKSERMCSLAKDALVEASQDNGVAIEKKKEIEAMLTQLKAQQAELDSTTKSIKAELEQAKLDEREAADKADTARKMGFAIALVGCVANGLAAAASMRYGGSVIASIIGGNTKQPETPEHKSIEVSLPSEIVELAKDIADKKGELAKLKTDLKNEVDEVKKKEHEKAIVQLRENIDSLDASRKEMMNTFNAMRAQANKTADSEAEREARLHADRVRLQELDRKANSDLCGTIEKLKGTTAEHDYLGQALASLDMAIKALGRIKTVFENTRTYWTGIKNHCDSLSDLSTFDLVQDMEEEFVEAITNSWYSWLTLGKINHAAVCAMEKVTDRIDSTMNDLPTTDEAQQRLPDLIKQMDDKLKIEISQT